MRRTAARGFSTPMHISRTGRDVNTLGNFDISVRSSRANLPVMIEGIRVSPYSGRGERLQVFNKQQSTFSGKIGDTQKFDTSVDIKLAYNGDYTSIFSKVIGCELSHSSSANLYFCCWVYFTSNAAGTEAPHLVDLGIPAVNAPDEVNRSKNQNADRWIPLICSGSCFWHSYSR